VSSPFAAKGALKTTRKVVVGVPTLGKLRKSYMAPPFACAALAPAAQATSTAAATKGAKKRVI
jgi:hypothetical protein